MNKKEAQEVVNKMKKHPDNFIAPDFLSDDPVAEMIDAIRGVRRFKLQLEKHTISVKMHKTITDDLIKLAKEFREFAKDCKSTDGSLKAVGLAINQCIIQKGGLVFNKRICAINDNGHWIVAINPWITNECITKEKHLEVCLSWPGKSIGAIRSSWIDIEYYDVDTKQIVKEKVFGLTGRIWQHEIDHLNGKKEIFVEKDYMTIKRTGDKQSRNGPCKCGSKKKFKKCCGVVK